MIFVILLLSASLISFALTWLMLRYALSRSLLDVPNQRSSHCVPTPRGGGVAFATTFLGFLPLLSSLNVLSTDFVIALFGGGAWITLIGFLDDRYDLPARWRLLAHCIAAAWVLYWIGSPPVLRLSSVAVPSGLLLSLLILIYCVWLINLYNFMDGIDGIASVQVITVCAGMTILYLVSKPTNTDWFASLLLLASVAGFLCWNYPPARIFMGDAGSGFLGVSIATISLQGASLDSTLFWGAIILSAVFIVDTTLTLVRRIFKRQRFYEAHRSHAYQNAAREFSSHRTVTLAVGVLNLVWLLPVALLVSLEHVRASFGLVIAYLPVIIIAYRFDAGGHEA